MKRIAVFTIAAIALCIYGAACGGGESESERTPDPAANVFVNGGFEDGKEPWFSLTENSDSSAWVKDFEVSDAQAHSGTQSAFVQLNSADEGPLDARRYGTVQEIMPDEFPERLAGCYYVEKWEHGTPRQYAQVAVIVFDPDGTNYQIRYVLFGVQEPPIEISNARFVMVGRGDPELGNWTCFDMDLRDDFEELWGAVPEGYQKIRFLFEVNWDERDPNDPPAIGDVYYDDLYTGPG